MEGKVRHDPHRRRNEEHVAPWRVQIPGDGHQCGEQAVAVGTVDGLFDGHAPLDAGGLRRSIQPRRFPDQIPVHPGDLFHLVERIFLHPLHEGLPAVHVPLDETLVVEVLFDDHLEETQGQRRVGPRAKFEPQIGPLGQKALSRIDDDEPGALL